MKIVNVGFDYRHPADFKIQRPNGSGDYALIVLRSSAFFVFDNITYHTKGDSVILLKKDTPQIFGADGGEFINDWIHFEADDADVEYIKNLGIAFDKVLEVRNITELSGLIKNIFVEKYSNNKNALNSADMYFRLILLKISDLLEQTANKSSGLFERLITLRNNIYSYPQKAWNIDNIAKEFFISKSYLQHQYKILFDKNIKSDITKSRITYSKYLLFSTDYTISAISGMCGYQNDVHFMRVFKREIGCTPTEYRNNSNYSDKKARDAKNYPPFSL